MEHDNKLEMKVTGGISAKRYRTVSFKLKADKQVFAIADLLSSCGPFPSVEKFIEQEVGQLVERYLERAKGLIGAASQGEIKVGRSKSRSGEG